MSLETALPRFVFFLWKILDVYKSTKPILMKPKKEQFKSVHHTNRRKEWMAKNIYKNFLDTCILQTLPKELNLIQST